LGPAVLGMLDTFSGRTRDKPIEVTKTTRPELPRNLTTPSIVVKYAPGPPLKTGERPPPPAEATVAPAQVSVRAGDRVTVDVDARALRQGSRLRLVLVPAGTPDDPAPAPQDVVAIAPDRVRVSLPAATAGPNEIRLYYVPPFGSEP